MVDVIWSCLPSAATMVAVVTEWTRRNDGIEEIDCDTIDEFLTVLDPASDDWGWMPTARRHRWIFRGHANSSWTLSPTAWRSPPTSTMAAARAEMSHRIPALTAVRQWDHTGTLPPPPIVDLDVARQVIVQANAEFMLVADFIHRADDLGIAPPSNLPHPLHHDGNYTDADRPVAADDFMLLIGGMPLLGALAQHHGIPTRLLDWSDDALTAAYFAASASSSAERLAVWALDERIATTGGIPLWGENSPRPVGLSLSVVRPQRSGNPYLRAQRGSFTVPWGAGCFALINGGRYPTLEDIAAGLNHNVAPILRRVTLPRSAAPLLRVRLGHRRVTGENLKPSLDVVADEVEAYWADREPSK